MKLKISKIIFLVCLMSCQSNLKNSSHSLIANNDLQKERLNLKNFAFCECMKYSNTIHEEGNDNSAAGFIQYSAYDENVFIDCTPFTKNWISSNKKRYVSKEQGANLNKMMCLDFYNSPALDLFVRKQDMKIDTVILKVIKTGYNH